MKEKKLGEFVFEVILKPLETLSKGKREDYKRAAVPVAREGFGNNEISESDIELHVLNSNTTIFARDNSGEIVGFSSSSIINLVEFPVVYLQGTALSEKGKSRGIYNVFNPLRIISEMEYLGVDEAYVSTRTQSPIVARNMIRKFGLHPSPRKKIPPEVMNLAKELAITLYHHHSDFRHPEGLQYDSKRLVQYTAYGNMVEGKPKGFCMYGDRIPWVEGDEQINRLLRDNLDFQNGDAMIFLGRVQIDRPGRMLEELT